jgi:glycosyltransferase 2 family protein
MSITTARVVRLIAASIILGALIWRLGAQPFLDGLARVSLPAVVAAVLLGAVATVSCAWRWQVVAGGLGLHMSLPTASADYYRSTFLNVTLPFGVVGDVHRAVRHGRTSGDLSGGVRGVAWERTAGQGVQIMATVALLLVLPSPVRDWMPAVAIASVALIGVLALLWSRGRPPARLMRLFTTVQDDLRSGVFARSSLPVVIATSLIVVLCHATTFVVAARSAGVTAATADLVAVTLLVLAAMAVPLSLAGWGPREGAAAWAFGAAGLTAAAGLTTAVVYGVLVLIASLPGAALHFFSWRQNLTVEPSHNPSEVAHG